MPNLGAAVPGYLGRFSLFLGLVKPGPQHGHGLLLILVLGTLVLAHYRQAAGLMDDTHRSGHFIDILPTVAPGVEDVYTQIIGTDFYINLVRLR